MTIIEKDIAAIVVLCLAFLFAIIVLWPRDPKPPKQDKSGDEPITWQGWHDE